MEQFPAMSNALFDIGCASLLACVVGCQSKSPTPKKETGIAVQVVDRSKTAETPASEGKKPAPKDAKLTPVTFKILDKEYMMDAPVGAVVEWIGEFPMIKRGDRFIMTIQPNTDADLEKFKQLFANPNLTIKKTLIEEENSIAYTIAPAVLNEAPLFKEEASVYMVVVSVGDEKFTCYEYGLDEIYGKEKDTKEDVDLMVKCAKTLRAAK